MSVWRTKKHGNILCCVDGGRIFAEIDPNTQSVRMVFEPGRSCLEDDAYDWEFRIEGDELLKRFTTTTFGEPPEVDWSTQRVLIALEGSERDRWLGQSASIYRAHREDRQRAARAQQRIAMEREEGFVAALPEDCSDLEFRKVGKGWGVCVTAQEPFWTDETFRYRGKDLFLQLRLVLSRLGRLGSFVPRMEDDDEDRCYFGE